MNPALGITGLGLTLGQRTILKDVQLELHAGSRTALIGPNGAGKTSLLDCIGGQVRATRGQVWLGEQEISLWPTHRRARAGLGRTFQRLGLLSDLGVLENVQLGLRNPGSPRAQGRSLEALAKVGFSDSPHRRAGDLSRLAQKQVVLARALVGRPTLLLLDEPAAGLNGGERQDLLQSIAAIHPQTTLLLVEHDLDFVKEATQRTLLLDRGGIAAEMPSPDAPAHPMVQDLYLGRRPA